jgi:uncharacterized protein YndB with AHSA1/START domain
MTRSDRQLAEPHRPEAHQPDPLLDLVLTRIIDVPKEQAWSAWTVPEQLVKWFTPAPWTTVSCELDLRPGGIFRTVMRSPEGKEFSHLGCYLEVVRKERLVWTNALGPTFRPAVPTTGVPLFTALIAFESHGRGTRYTALVMHKDPESRAQHEAMGFHDGWGKALDQLVAAAKRT